MAAPAEDRANANANVNANAIAHSHANANRRAHPPLPHPTAEQAAALRSLVDDGLNVILVSVAGSGKTTFALHAATALAPARVLLCTYNAQLKRETRAKVRALGLQGSVEVHSYHSFAYRYLSDACSTDDGLCDALDAQQPPRHDVRFDLLVFDECQDMKPLFLRLVRFVELHNCTTPHNRPPSGPPRYVIVGDPRQSIYGFQGADARYLELADRVFGGALARAWRRHELTVTWRLTTGMADFVNAAFLNGERVLDAPRAGVGLRPVFHSCDCYGDAPVRVVRGWLASGVRPEDVMVLAPSLRSRNSPVRALENRLVRLGVRVYVPISDEEPVDKKAVRGKVLFATFHQAKGAERDAVLVFGMDDSYTRFFCRDADANTCPNAVYVAVTRARERLALLQDRRNGPLPFLDQDAARAHADVVVEGAAAPVAALPEAAAAAATAPAPRRYSVHDLLRHVPREVLRDACAELSFAAVAPPAAEPLLQLDQNVPTDPGMVEQVAEITGIALPALATGRTDDILRSALDQCPTLRHRLRLARIREAAGAGTAPSPADMLFASAVHASCNSGYMFKPAQIRRYDWLLQEHVDAAAAFLRSVGATDPDARHEVDMRATAAAPGIGEVVVRGRADIVTPCALFELKCSACPFQREHMLQLAVYAWMASKEPAVEGEEPRRRFVLAYVCTGEVYELDPDPVALDRAVARLLAQKAARAEPAVSDDEFVRRANCLGLGQHSDNTFSMHTVTVLYSGGRAIRDSRREPMPSSPPPSSSAFFASVAVNLH